MGKCGTCTGDTAIVGGEGVRVVGSGSPTNPYVVTADTADLTNSFIVNDSPSVDLELVGAGVPGDPLRLTATSRVGLRDLSDVGDNTAPAIGDVPVWVMDARGGGWYFQPPPTVAAGTLSKRASSGLIGDGSGGSPLGVATSGIWGVNVGVSTGDSTTGQPIYVDSAGQLRAAPVAPPSSISWGSIDGKPTVYPSRWDLVTQKPTAYPTTWANIADKPALALREHFHDDRYPTRADADFRYALNPPAGLFGGRAVLDVTGANKMGLRWNGARVVMRVDNSEWEIPNLGDVVATNATVDHLNRIKTNAFVDTNTSRHARGPDSGAYNRGMAGSGWFSVWMDNTLQFGRNTSSRRFKEEIEPIEVDPSDVLALQPVTYHRIGSDHGREFGMIAEDVNEHVPEIVTWFAEHGSGDEPIIDGIRYDLLAVAQQSVLRDQQKRIEQLEAHVARLMREN